MAVVGRTCGKQDMDVWLQGQGERVTANCADTAWPDGWHAQLRLGFDPRAADMPPGCTDASIGGLYGCSGPFIRKGRKSAT